jgi:hypothetical protein
VATSRTCRTVANKLAKIKVLKDGEEASIRYLHNALGQRVVKGEPQAERYQPNEAELGQDFISHARYSSESPFFLKKNGFLPLSNGCEQLSKIELS